MPMHDRQDEEELDAREMPDDSDMDDDDDPEMVPCPHCRKMISEETERCPRCGSYISDEDAPAHKPWLFILAVGLMLLIAIMWAVFR